MEIGSVDILGIFLPERQEVIGVMEEGVPVGREQMDGRIGRKTHPGKRCIEITKGKIKLAAREKEKILRPLGLPFGMGLDMVFDGYHSPCSC